MTAVDTVAVVAVGLALGVPVPLIMAGLAVLLCVQLRAGERGG